MHVYTHTPALSIPYIYIYICVCVCVCVCVCMSVCLSVWLLWDYYTKQQINNNLYPEITVNNLPAERHFEFPFSVSLMSSGFLLLSQLTAYCVEDNKTCKHQCLVSLTRPTKSSSTVWCQTVQSSVCDVCVCVCMCVGGLFPEQSVALPQSTDAWFVQTVDRIRTPDQ